MLTDLALAARRDGRPSRPQRHHRQLGTDRLTEVISARNVDPRHPCIVILGRPCVKQGGRWPGSILAPELVSSQDGWNGAAPLSYRRTGASHRRQARATCIQTATRS